MIHVDELEPVALREPAGLRDLRESIFRRRELESRRDRRSGRLRALLPFRSPCHPRSHTPVRRQPHEITEVSWNKGM